MCWPFKSLLAQLLAGANIKANKFLRTLGYGFGNFDYGFFKLERPGKHLQSLNRAKLIYLNRFELTCGAGGRD